MDAVPYKRFFIVVTIRRAISTENRFHVVNQVHRNLEEPPGMRDSFPVQEFASENDAYAFGVKEAKRWIDEQD